MFLDFNCNTILVFKHFIDFVLFMPTVPASNVRNILSPLFAAYSTKRCLLMFGITQGLLCRHGLI